MRLTRTVSFLSRLLFLALLSGCATALINTDGAGFSEGLDQGWTVEGGNPQRTRSVPVSIEPPLRLRSTFALERDTQLVSPPIIGNGLLVADSARRLSGFSLESGEEEWFINLAGSYLSPVITENLVLVRAEADDDGYLIALNGDAATIAWEYQFPVVGSGARKIGGHVTAPLAVGELVFSGASKTMTALYLESGELAWEFKAEEPIASAASADAGVLYFADFANLYALDAKTGGELWRFSFEDTTSLIFAPIVTESAVLVSSGEVVHLVDKATGAPLWERQFAGEAMIPAAAAGTTVFVKAVNRLWALDEGDGSILWEYGATDFVSIPVVTETHLYVIARAGGKSQLRAVDILDGAEAWRMDGEEFSNAAPIAADEYILARTADGRILVFGGN